ncbi:MAG: hypothetical protein IIV89_03670, partial [Bacteroidaceae bacterium]|nr:hypothetical protein [Bacteroidaceae bacterium]
MQKRTTIILITAAALITQSCNILQGTKKTATLQKDAKADSVWTQYTQEMRPATEVKFEIPNDSLTGDGYAYELPESMNANIDSLLNNWQTRHILKSPESSAATRPIAAITDTMYAKRLASMYTIVRMPYNNIVRSYIDRYVNKNRSQVAYMLGAAELYM